MIENNELLAFLMTMGVGLLVSGNMAYFRRIPLFPLLFAGLWLLLAAWTLSILEGFIFPVVCNFLEHICYLLSSLCLALWLFASPVTRIEKGQ